MKGWFKTNNINIYLAGGMGKFGKENFQESNYWRQYCKYTIKNYEKNMNVIIMYI